MFVHPVPGGATYIFEHKAPLGTIANAIALVAAAQAPRKTIVFGTISDYPGARSPRYRKIAREALDAADRVIFTGPGSGHVTKLAQGPFRERLFSFETTYQAYEFLKAETVPGELVLLKGSTRSDHLERIILSQLDRIVWERLRQRARLSRMQELPPPVPPCALFGDPSGPGGQRDAELTSRSQYEMAEPRHGSTSGAVREIGGHDRNRTGVHGFAVRCVTTPPRGLVGGLQEASFTK